MNKEERDKEERIVFEEFRNSLNKCKNFVEAQLLVKRELPSVNAPGRQYYSNLIFFLNTFHTHGSASKDELILYRDYIIRLHKTGQLKPGEGQRIIDKLNKDIEENSY